MSDPPDTIFLRLEGPLQAWGDTSKFVVHRTMEAPTKSGVMGLICCAMGLNRAESAREPIESPLLRTLCERVVPEKDTNGNKYIRSVLTLLRTLQMGVRIDRAGTRWWDYHTVGAKVGILRADGKGIKRTGGRKDDPIETLISRREYLCDASFLVALKGDSALIEEVASALQNPRWTLFLGRKSCPPSLPVLVTAEQDDGSRKPLIRRFENLKEALEWEGLPWQPRLEDDTPRDDSGKTLKNIALDCLLEWRASKQQPIAGPETEVWYDAPASFDPPNHEPRLVVRDTVLVKVGPPAQQHTLPPSRPRAGYSTHKWREVIRPDRLRRDQGLCVFCKSTATTVQHITYRRAGGNEEPEDLRSLCRLCHDAVTMIEYGLGMGLDRINPEEPQWRDSIIAKRDEIRRWRSEEGRRRALRAAPEKVRREMLEQEEE